MRKSISTIGLMLILVFLIFLSEVRGEEYCYEPYGVSVTPEFLAEWAFVKFNWVEGERGMEAFAEYTYDEETNSTVCVVTVRMPDQVIGDPDMDAIGHEIMHCATGDFHPGEH